MNYKVWSSITKFTGVAGCLLNRILITGSPHPAMKILINQLTSPVLWKQTINKLIADNYKSFIECGPGRVLQGLVKKINRDMDVSSI